MNRYYETPNDKMWRTLREDIRYEATRKLRTG